MKKSAIVFSLCLASGTQLAQAYDLPAVNLGLTSFLDGGLPAGPGWYFQEYGIDYNAHRLNDNRGNNAPLPKTDVHFQAMASQLSYLSDVHWGNAALGWNMVLPIVTKMDVDDGLNHNAIKAQSGMGDLLFGPFFQFDPIMGKDGPKFIHRIEVDMIAPTGDYDSHHDINPSSHAWSFNPYWAGTYFFTPKWTASARLHYLYNFKNDDPGYGYGDVSDVQAGQAIHANFATEYAVTDKLRLGVNGYWLNQITDTKVDGHEVSGRREKVWAIGPGAMYSFSKDDHVFANAYFEQDVKNRPEGTRLVFRYTHHF
ncbi:transporter [Pseudomonas sp. NPDC096950]|uniref:SphA family protein n=1 Tax=Pseudomonas sp. NPDC096950 TaxID=3364485 RepID=UPI00383ABA25